MKISEEKSSPRISTSINFQADVLQAMDHEISKLFRSDDPHTGGLRSRFVNIAVREYLKRRKK